MTKAVRRRVSSARRAGATARTMVAFTAFGVLVGSIPAPIAGQIEVTGATIADLQDAMTAGRATSAQITEAYLDRIAAYDKAGPALNAMIWLNPNAVMEAEALDRERAATGSRGPMHGVPVILKDNYDTYDLPTSAGTLALAGNVAPDDAFQVARLREAGAVIIGKANMHELASGITTISSLGGQTLNPYDLRRNPGGSSGGTGAAIAASFAAIGWGSDTCGSIRIPSAQNDLVGLRPTKGLSSIDGIIPLSHTQDVGGPLARTVRDLATALDVTVGRDPADAATALLDGRVVPNFTAALDEGALAGARIGILEEYFGSGGDEAAAASVVRDAIARMVELGADTVTVEIPELSDLISGSGVIGYEFKWDLIDYLAANPNAPVASLREMLELGLIHEALTARMRTRDEGEFRDSDEYRETLAKRAPLREAVETAMNRHSVAALVFPTVRTIPAIIGDPQLGSSCSLSANTGLPSLSVQAGFTNEGLPIGMEMIGRTLDDAHLVSLGYAFEQATNHRREPWSTPPLVDRRARSSVPITVRPGWPEGAGPSGSAVEIDAELSLDPVRNELTFRVEATGVSAADVFAIVLRSPAEDGALLVARRLSGPGTTRTEGVLELTAELRHRIDLGETHLAVYTREHPFGAASVLLLARD